MAQSYLDYHPEKRHLRWLFYGLATAPPALIAYKRVQALKHFPSDVVAGLIIGAAGGTLLPKLHQKRKHKNMSLGFTYEPQWKVVSCRWKM
jgi:membrane-associated phospholipid phosphatase